MGGAGIQEVGDAAWLRCAGIWIAGECVCRCGVVRGFDGRGGSGGMWCAIVGGATLVGIRFQSEDQRAFRQGKNGGSLFGKRNGERGQVGVCGPQKR